MYQSQVQTICKNIQKTEEQIERLNEELCKNELSYNEKKAKYEEIQTEITAEKISYKVVIFIIIIFFFNLNSFLDWKTRKKRSL